MKKHISAVLALGLLVIVAAACSGSFSTANISELKFGKTDDANPATTTFKTGEDIYAVATVSNASGKYKLNWRITYEKVAGKAAGEEIGTKSIDFDGSKVLWQQFSSPLPGEYKAEATLTDESGKKLDSKSGTVTITGTAPSETKKGDDKKDDDDN
jgi:hypothetical protein